jgi:hypothetical protein
MKLFTFITASVGAIVAVGINAYQPSTTTTTTTARKGNLAVNMEFNESNSIRSTSGTSIIMNRRNLLRTVAALSTTAGTIFANNPAPAAAADSTSGDDAMTPLYFGVGVS